MDIKISNAAIRTIESVLKSGKDAIVTRKGGGVTVRAVEMKTVYSAPAIGREQGQLEPTT